MNIGSIIRKVEEIERLCHKVVIELRTLQTEADARMRSGETADQDDSENLKKTYDNLYREFEKGSTTPVGEYVSGSTRDSIRLFCRANNLIIDKGRESKKAIVDMILQSMRVRRAMSRESWSTQNGLPPDRRPDPTPLRLHTSMNQPT